MFDVLCLLQSKVFFSMIVFNSMKLKKIFFDKRNVDFRFLFRRVDVCWKILIVYISNRNFKYSFKIDVVVYFLNIDHCVFFFEIIFDFFCSRFFRFCIRDLNVFFCFFDSLNCSFQGDRRKWNKKRLFSISV